LIPPAISTGFAQGCEQHPETPAQKPEAQLWILRDQSTKKCRANDNSRKAETARPCDAANVKTNQNAIAAGISGAA
jgi:hypothetical protein